MTCSCPHVFLNARVLAKLVLEKETSNTRLFVCVSVRMYIDLIFLSKLLFYYRRYFLFLIEELIYEYINRLVLFCSIL